MSSTAGPSGRSRRSSTAWPTCTSRSSGPASLGWFAALTIAEEDPRRREAASLAKAAAGECQRLVVGEGLQLHGGIGFTWEHDLHFLLKRAKVGDALFGNAVAHRSELARMLGLVGAEGEAA